MIEFLPEINSRKFLTSFSLRRGSGWFSYSANCVGARCLDVGCFKFTEEEAKFPFLGAWEFLDVGVLEAFVVGCRRVQPINLIRCQFWIVLFWFHHHAMVDIIMNESFLDLRSRRQHRQRIWYSRHRGWRQRRQKLHRQTLHVRSRQRNRWRLWYSRQRRQFRLLVLHFCIRTMVVIV